MKITFNNTMKFKPDWYQSIHILPSISYYKDCNTNHRSWYVYFIIFCITIDL